MPRIRALKPEFFEDEDLAEFPFWVRLLYQGLWVNADKSGRLQDRPVRLKAKIFPYDNIDVGKGLAILANPKKHSPTHRPFIIRYSVNGENYIQIVAWDDHQSPHNTEKESSIPPFNGEITVTAPLLNRDTQVAPEQGTMNHEPLIFKGGVWGGITETDKTAWASAYPACDIELELNRMAEWIKANPARGKKSNYRRFIVNWLNRSQDRGGSIPKGSAREVEIQKERRVGRRHPAFEDSLTDEAKSLLPAIDAEWEQRFDNDPLGTPDKNYFRTIRLKQISQEGAL